MRTFLVSDISGAASRVIEADSFIVEESGYTVFHDENSNLVARFINVTVEPISASRESSKALVKIAQKYRNFDLFDQIMGPGMSPEEVNKISEDVKSLAGSVLSQASKD